MFGDFSRFENDPEIGLNGIYLSQGSPILDSDWNEQVAALTDWITVVGRLSAGETIRWLGFESSVSEDKKTFSVNPGVALISGRVIQSTRTLSTGSSSFGRGFVGEFKAGDEHEILLVVTERRVPKPSIRQNMSIVGSSTRSVTEWTIYVRPGQLSINTEESRGAVTSGKAQVAGARSFGDTGHLTPRLTVSWRTSDSLFANATAKSLMCILECDTAIQTDSVEMRFKWATCPQNSFQPVEWKDVAFDVSKTAMLTYSGVGCGMLDLLENVTPVWIEVVDDHTECEQAAALFGNIGAIATSKLVEYEYDPKTRTLNATGSPVVVASADKNPQIRVWNAKVAAGRGFPFLDPERKSGPERNLDGVRAELIFQPGQDLLPGDRWYIPVTNGLPALVSGDSVAGHRVFRAFAKLGHLTIDKHSLDMTWKAIQSSTPIAKSERTQEIDTQTQLTSDALDDRLPEQKRAPLLPVAYHLDDSLHRLTGALNAARSLTRQTPCKELKTRVSYLPLRRWLASAYVHEFADLQLDGFLAKVRRSIDVAPEDEHRFREQASLVLEEANQLAGSLPQPTKEQPAYNPNTVAAVQPPGEMSTLLGASRRDVPNQRFIQEGPRS